MSFYKPGRVPVNPDLSGYGTGLNLDISSSSISKAHKKINGSTGSPFRFDLVCLRRINHATMPNKLAGKHYKADKLRIKMCPDVSGYGTLRA